MRTMMKALSAAVIAVGALASSPSLAKTEIGAVGAAAPLIEGTPPSAQPRTLETGVRVLRDERIQTSASGVGQILFDDQSSLSVAPNSDVTLDKYIYDPKTGRGEISMTLTKGAMRFIGGRITKNTEATVKTRTGTMGIRGGMALMIARPDGSLEIVNLGALFIRYTTPKQTIHLSRASAFAVVRPNGEIVFGGLRDKTGTAADFALFRPRKGVSSANLSTLIANAGGQTAFNEPGAVLRDPVSTDGADNANGTLDDDSLRSGANLIELIERAIQDQDFVVDTGGPPAPEGPTLLQRSVKHAIIQSLLIDSVGVSPAVARSLMVKNGVWLPPGVVRAQLRDAGLLNARIIRRTIIYRLLKREGIQPNFLANPRLTAILIRRLENGPSFRKPLRRVSRQVAIHRVENTSGGIRYKLSFAAAKFSRDGEGPRMNPREVRRYVKTLPNGKQRAFYRDTKYEFRALPADERKAIKDRALKKLTKRILKKKVLPDVQRQRRLLRRLQEKRLGDT